MEAKEIIDLVQNLGAPVVYSLLALWFIKFQFVKAEDAANRSREERQRLIDDFTKRDAENEAKKRCENGDQGRSPHRSVLGRAGV